MIYIALKDNKIIFSCESNSEKGVVSSLQYEGITAYDEIKPIPNEYFAGKVGNDIREFDSNYDLLPEIERMKSGYLTIPKGKKMNEKKTELIDKTVKEKIDDGEIELNEYQKYDEETKEIRAKKNSELFSDGLLTLEDYINSYVRPQRNYLLDRVDIVHCNALNLIKMSDAKKQEWETYKQKLKDLPDNVTEVKDNVEELFPVMPE